MDNNKKKKKERKRDRGVETVWKIIKQEKETEM
jgi:hypothetical protein